MLAIVLNHTDFYLAGEVVVSFELFGTNALMTFFVVSGYLFYRENFDIRRKLSSEFRHLVIPYFIFTIIIVVPKILVRGEEFVPKDVLLGIVCGQASWFVAARAVAGVLFALLITVANRFCRLILPVGCAALAVVPFIFRCDALRIWNLDIALMSLVYLCLGYFYHVYEEAAGKRLRLWMCIPVLLFAVLVKCAEQHYGFAVPVSPVGITSFPVFLIDTVPVAFVVIALCRRYDGCPFLNYVGRNSIVFYFLCGGVPLLMGMAFRRIGLCYGGNYLITLLDFAAVLMVMSALAYIITRWFPFMIGKTRSEIKRAL